MSFSPFLQAHGHAKVHDDEMIPTYKVQKIIGVNINIEYLLSIGLKPVVTTKTGAFWRKSDIPTICQAIAADMMRVIKDFERRA